jgi:hypothetical protein
MFTNTLLNHPIIHSNTQDHIPTLFYHHPIITITLSPAVTIPAQRLLCLVHSTSIPSRYLTAPTETDDCRILRDPHVSSLRTLSKCVYEAWATSQLEATSDNVSTSIPTSRKALFYWEYPAWTLMVLHSAFVSYYLSNHHLDS